MSTLADSIPLTESIIIQENGANGLSNLKKNLMKQLDKYTNEVKTNLKKEEEKLQQTTQAFEDSLRAERLDRITYQPFIRQSLYLRLRRRFMFKSAHEQTKHEGFPCKICQTAPILGNRYECSTCSKFSMCEKCYISSSGKASHKHFFYCLKDRKEPLLTSIKEEVNENKMAICTNLSSLTAVLPYKDVKEDYKVLIKLKNTGKLPWPSPIAIDSVINESDVSLFEQTIREKNIAPNQEVEISYPMPVNLLNNLEIGHYTILFYIKYKKVWFGKKIPFHLEIKENK